MMKLWTRSLTSGLLRGICCILLSGGITHAGDISAVKPVENVTLPLDRYEDGTIKTQLVAGKAKPSENGGWEGTNVRIEFYDETGKIECTVTADDCRYNTETGTARSDANVCVDRGDVVITGTGFEWDSKSEKVKILNNVRVIMKDEANLMKGIER